MVLEKLKFWKKDKEEDEDEEQTSKDEDLKEAGYTNRANQLKEMKEFLEAIEQNSDKVYSINFESLKRIERLLERLTKDHNELKDGQREILSNLTNKLERVEKEEESEGNEPKEDLKESIDILSELTGRDKDLIEFVAQNQPVTYKDVAQGLDISQNRARGYVSSALDKDFPIQKTKDGRTVKITLDKE